MYQIHVVCQLNHNYSNNCPYDISPSTAIASSDLLNIFTDVFLLMRLLVLSNPTCLLFEIPKVMLCILLELATYVYCVPRRWKLINVLNFCIMNEFDFRRCIAVL